MSDGGFLAGPSAESKETPVELSSAPVQPDVVEAPTPVAEPVVEAHPIGPPTPEQIADPELAVHEEEKNLLEAQAEEEKKEAFLETDLEKTPPTQAAASNQAVAAPVVSDPIMLDVEKILEEGLGDYVETMPEEARARFLAKGKEVSGVLAQMVRTFNVELRKAIALIRDWLLTIPGINRYFLEQDAKIKTDRIIELARTRKEEAEPKV